MFQIRMSFWVKLSVLYKKHCINYRPFKNWACASQCDVVLSAFAKPRMSCTGVTDKGNNDKKKKDMFTVFIVTRQVTTSWQCRFFLEEKHISQKH